MDKWRGTFTYSSNGIVKIFYGNSKEECRRQAYFWPLQAQETCRLYVVEEEYQKIDEMEPVKSIIARANELVFKSKETIEDHSLITLKEYREMHMERLEEVCKLAIENNESLIQYHMDNNELHVKTTSNIPVLYVKMHSLEIAYKYFPIYYEWKNRNISKEVASKG